MAPSRFLPVSLAAAAAIGFAAVAALRFPAHTAEGGVLTGQAALGDWTTDAPGVVRHITLADLPPPFATRSVDNGPHDVPRPDGALPKVLPGFRVTDFATGLNNPRKIITAPNGDLFVVESGPGRVLILRDSRGKGKPETREDFASGLDQPFGIAFYPNGKNPKWMYVANTGGVVRFPYRNGDLHASGPAETICDDVPSGGRLRGGGHWTRDIAFSPDNRTMYVSVGSASNVMQNAAEEAKEPHRADILAYSLDRDGKTTGERIYASGIRNAVGIAIQPGTNQLWMSTNERDGLGDLLPPDYISRVKEGAFYGWPWYYLGDHQDPRHAGEHPELAGKITVPDVLVQAHSASLALTFYEGGNFPAKYRGQIFACEHGSWNRSHRTGYKVIRAILDSKGRPTGEYEDFVTGFVANDGQVWGRPVGVTVGRDGALYFTDDGSGTVWRVVYEGAK